MYVLTELHVTVYVGVGQEVPSNPGIPDTDNDVCAAEMMSSPVFGNRSTVLDTRLSSSSEGDGDDVPKIVTS